MTIIRAVSPDLESLEFVYSLPSRINEPLMMTKFSIDSLATCELINHAKAAVIYIKLELEANLRLFEKEKEIKYFSEKRVALPRKDTRERARERL